MGINITVALKPIDVKKFHSAWPLSLHSKLVASTPCSGVSDQSKMKSWAAQTYTSHIL